MLKKALRNLIGLGGRTGTDRKKAMKSCRLQTVLSLEPLEDRRLLAAFDLSAYELHHDVPDDPTGLPGAGGDADFSGVVYHEPTQSFFIVSNGANNNNGAIHEYKYEEIVVEGETVLELAHQRVIDFKNFDVPGGTNTGDPEGLAWMGGDKFVFVRERVGIVHEFWIDADGTVDGDSDVDGDSNSDDITDEVDKDGDSISTIPLQPNPTSNVNTGLEGITYDSDRSVFYVVKEKTWQDVDGQNGLEIIYQVDPAVQIPANDNLTAVHVDGLIAAFNGKDVADVYYFDDQMFLLSEEGKDITKLILDTVPNPDVWEIAAGDPFDLSDMNQPEGITFSTDGFDMFVVGEDREFFHYRNYTSFTPNAAPDLDAASDTGDEDDDNITTDTKPTFTGTLTRTVGGNTVPLDAAWVFLYIDGSPTGDSAETDENGAYSITPEMPLVNGDYRITIKVGEEDDTLDERPENLSIVSDELGVVIHPSAIIGDLNGDSAINFQDLTILLANWETGGTYAQGNIAFTFVENATINFADLTLLLANWNGSSPAANPQFALATPSQEYEDTIYSTSTDFFVQFDAAVSGVDATDLELSGTGGSGASVGAPTNLGSNIYSFPVTGLSIGTVDVDVAPDEDDITYVTGGEWVGLKEWTFTALPGVTFSSGALLIEGTSGDDTIDLSAGISTKAWSFKRMPLNTAVYAMSA